MFRKIFGRKRMEVTGGWRKFRNEELHYLCFSPNMIRVMKLRKKRGMRLAERKIKKRKINSSYLSGTSKVKSPFELSRCRRVDNNWMDVKGTEHAD